MASGFSALRKYSRLLVRRRPLTSPLALFQSEAWSTCNILLMSPETPPTAQLFAAQTFRTKVGLELIDCTRSARTDLNFGATPGHVRSSPNRQRESARFTRYACCCFGEIPCRSQDNHGPAVSSIVGAGITASRLGEPGPGPDRVVRKESCPRTSSSPVLDHSSGRIDLEHENPCDGKHGSLSANAY